MISKHLIASLSLPVVLLLSCHGNQQSLDLKIDGPQQVALVKAQGQGQPQGITISAEADLKGRLVLRQTNFDQVAYDYAIEEKGHTNWRTDWYADTCWIVLQPEDGTRGSLRLRYEFLE